MYFYVKKNFSVGSFFSADFYFLLAVATTESPIKVNSCSFDSHSIKLKWALYKKYKKSIPGIDIKILISIFQLIIIVCFLAFLCFSFFFLFFNCNSSLSVVKVHLMCAGFKTFCATLSCKLNGADFLSPWWHSKLADKYFSKKISSFRLKTL